MFARGHHVDRHLDLPAAGGRGMIGCLGLTALLHDLGQAVVTQGANHAREVTFYMLSP
jgi:hypothetical protein